MDRRSINDSIIFSSITTCSPERGFESAIWRGQLAEPPLHFNRMLSDGERREIESYLAEKYGITLSREI